MKYADLSTSRRRDLLFSFDRMLALDGNTAPYLQYAHARIQSIFKRGGVTPLRDGRPLIVAEPAERTLVLELLAFPSVVSVVADTLEFHRLAGYLYGLSTAFTGFYERCPVLKADEPVRGSRLALCDLIGRVLAAGLNLLGIAAPDRM